MTLPSLGTLGTGVPVESRSDKNLKIIYARPPINGFCKAHSSSLLAEISTNFFFYPTFDVTETKHVKHLDL